MTTDCFLDLTADQYHADSIGDRPTLSRSIANILCTQSPAHAYTAHPRLNPDWQRVEEDKFDLGTAVHDLLLGGPERLAVCDYKDWRTNEAKEAKFRARVQGQIPMLTKDHSRVLEMAEAVRDQIADWNRVGIEPPLLVDGKAEVTLAWEDEGVACRARLDWLRDDHTAIDDIKSTSRSANPEDWSMFSFGGDLQSWMYSRAVEVLTGTLPVFRFIVCEVEPPYAVSVVTPGPDVLTLARKKFAYAAGVWRRCLESGEWPMYDRRVATVELPAWLENRWLLKEEREMVA